MRITTFAGPSLVLGYMPAGRVCELDRTYVGGVERGERNLSLMNIEKITLAFRVSLSELFKCV
jgi:transcriptional regulator with XRE-family HTH domain